MRRLSLSTKLLAAALPLVVALAGLLVITIRADLDQIGRAERGAELGSVWAPLINALNAVDDEADSIVAAPSDQVAVGSDADDMIADVDARRASDDAINEVRNAIEGLGASEAAAEHITASRSSLSGARRSIDLAEMAPQVSGDVDPIDAYRSAARELVAIGQLLPSEAGDPELGSELLAVVKLAEARLRADDVITGMSAWPNIRRDTIPLVQANAAFADMAVALGEFQTVAPSEWTSEFRNGGFATEIGRLGTELDRVTRAADEGRVQTFDTEAFESVIADTIVFQRSISQSIVDRAAELADDARSAALVRTGIILATVLLAAIVAWLITRSVTRRVKAVAAGANQVASVQLPALVEALKDPRGKGILPDVASVDASGSDDLADLADAFNSMQSTLLEVAQEQVEVLRRGVSDIFVTMARRNRSLIDRQLAMLDEYEAGVDDPDVLANYYQLDHLATRMRRNSESLLVLANAEPRRRRVEATQIDDVVRASIGEVEDYLRIEIQNLESLKVRGNVVADISHLLAELLDNATSFSPPASPVRVGGRRFGGSYMLRIVDDGVGIGSDRLAELNDLLRHPPIVGLSVESTLGISVVSLLANKHGIAVTLSAGNSGLTVDVVLPNSLFDDAESPGSPSTRPIASNDPIDAFDAWNQQTETPAPTAAPEGVQAAHEAISEPIAAALAAIDVALLAESGAAPATAPPTAHEPATPVAASPVAPDPVAPPIVAERIEPSIEPPVEPPVVPDLPPPAPARAEFDVPPAPPMSTNGSTSRPVTPPIARVAPNQTIDVVAPSLPTRAHRTNGPEGPDRMADTRPDTPNAAVAEADPGALQAALAAFDQGRTSASAGTASVLPTRAARASDAPAVIDDVQPVSSNRIDPNALRDRLRAFQSEFSSGQAEPMNTTDDPQASDLDLGGDHR